MEPGTLPSDWEKQIVRAYTMFGVDPSDAEFGLGFPRLSTSFLREKAERQLRDKFGRWREQRGELFNGLAGRVPHIMRLVRGEEEPLRVSQMRHDPTMPGGESVFGDGIVQRGEFDAATGIIALDPKGPPRTPSVFDDPRALDYLLKDWLKRNHVKIGFSDDDIDEVLEDPEYAALEYHIGEFAKLQVASALADDLSDLSTEELHAVVADMEQRAPTVRVMPVPKPIDQERFENLFEPEPRFDPVTWILLAQSKEPRMDPFDPENSDRTVVLDKESGELFAMSRDFVPPTGQQHPGAQYTYARLDTPEGQSLLRDAAVLRMMRWWEDGSGTYTGSLAFQKVAAQDLDEGLKVSHIEEADPRLGGEFSTYREKLAAWGELDTPFDPEYRRKWEEFKKGYKVYDPERYRKHEREFDVNRMKEIMRSMEERYRKRTEGLLAKEQEMRQILDAQHVRTKALFNALGVDSVEIFRGMKPNDEEMAQMFSNPQAVANAIAEFERRRAAGIGGPESESAILSMLTDLVQRPLSAWTASMSVAEMFASGEVDASGPGKKRPGLPMVVAKRQPVDGILSTALSGFGYYLADELVPYADNGEVNVLHPADTLREGVTQEDIFAAMQRWIEQEVPTQPVPVDTSTDVDPTTEMAEWIEELHRPPA